VAEIDRVLTILRLVWARLWKVLKAVIVEVTIDTVNMLGQMTKA
jgi:hypothetical protein